MDTIDWLLADDADPAIRWQVMRDLTDATPDAVAAERARMATEGWASDLLAAQNPDGSWGGNGPDWVTWSGTWRDTMYTAWLLADFGRRPRRPAVRGMIDDACATASTGARSSATTRTSPARPRSARTAWSSRPPARSARWTRRSSSACSRTQLEDGGWNCDAPESKRASFHSTITVLEGLLAAEQAGTAPRAPTEARQRGEEYLLDRGMFRSLRTGEELDPAWSLFAYPFSWHYDILRGLEHLRVGGRRARRARRRRDRAWSRAGAAPTAPGLGMRWHGERVRYAMEEAGAPSRWNTLRALRVIEWFRG